MATMTKAQAIAALKKITGQASTANAISRGSLMPPGQLGQYGITPALLKQIRGEGTPVASPSTFQGTALSGLINQSDRGSDPAFQAANPTTQSGNSLASWPATTFNNNPGNSLASSPATNYSAPAGTSDLDRGSDPMRNWTDPGYAPTLSQEQKNAQANAQPVGSSVYTANSTVNPGGPISGASSTIPGLITKMPTVNIPNAPNVHVAWHDFTPQATARTNTAYAPLYQALSGAKTNATTQATTAQASIKGMYDNLDRQTAADKATQAATTNTAVANTQAAGDKLKSGISNAYGSAGKDMAALLASTGVAGAQGNAAAQTLGTTFGNSADAQANAAQATAENVANAKAQGTNQSDYLTNMSNADRAQSISSRETVQSQLGNVLQQYDNQGLSTKADQAQQTLSLNQQMGSNDFGAQQANASQANTAYQQAMSKAQMEQQNNLASIGLQNAGILNQQQQAASQAAAQQAAVTAQNNYNLGIYKANTTLTKAQLEAATAAGKQVSVDTNSAADRASREAIAAAAIQAKNPNSPTNLANSNPQTKYYNELYGLAAQGGSTDPATTAVGLKKLVASAYDKSTKTQGGDVSYVEFLGQIITQGASMVPPINEQQATEAAAAYQRAMNGRGFLLQNPSTTAYNQYGTTTTQ